MALQRRGEDDRVGSFRATLPGPGTYSFAITTDDGQPYWTDLLTVTETDEFLRIWPDRIPLESFPHATAPVSGGVELPPPANLNANAGATHSLEALAVGSGLRIVAGKEGSPVRQANSFTRNPGATSRRGDSGPRTSRFPGGRGNEQHYTYLDAEDRGRHRVHPGSVAVRVRELGTGGRFARRKRPGTRTAPWPGTTNTGSSR